MNINWLGQSCFQISTSQSKGEPLTIVIDPFEEKEGLKLPRNLEADIVLTTHGHWDHNNVKRVAGAPFVIDSPGEYDVKDVYIRGIQSYHDNSQGKERGGNAIFTIETEEMRICHLGDLGQKELTTEQLEAIGEVDILMIPVGGIYTINGQEAIKVMGQIEPKITMPMHYKTANFGSDLEKIDGFLKSLGIQNLQSIPKLSVKKKDIPAEEAKIVLLEA